jgi:hypothetical protein
MDLRFSAAIRGIYFPSNLAIFPVAGLAGLTKFLYIIPTVRYVMVIGA